MAFQRQTIRNIIVGAGLIGATAIITACSLFKISATDDSKLQQSAYNDLSSTVIEVGKPAPDFSLPDPDGKTVSLNSITDKQPVLVIFYRGDWCPFCISQLDSIKEVLPQLKKKGVQVIAISPDEAAAAQNTRRQFGQGFIFLTDPKASVIEQYGIARDDKLPHPAVYLIKQGGEVGWFYASEDYKVRPTGEQLLKMAETRL